MVVSYVMIWKNYRAWEIDLHDFHNQKTDQDRLRFFLRFAVLAPSSHNSQPWRFTARDREIIIYPDTRRALPRSDVNHRQLFVSLGCAIENIIVAADYYGFATTIVYENDGAKIFFTKIREQLSPDSKHLIFAIPKRHTNRNPYHMRVLRDGFMTWIRGLSGGDPHITCITDCETKNNIADIVVAAGIAAMNDRGFCEELSHYVKSNITKEKVGMPGFGMSIPMPISLIAPFILKLLNMNKLMQKKDEKLLKEQTPVFIVISTKKDTPQSWMRAGRIYERIALGAEQENIKTAPMAAAIQIGEFYRGLQRVLRLSLRPQVFFRMGYTETITPHSPRLGAHEVIVP